MSNKAKKASGPVYPLCYVGPTVSGLHHGTVFTNREAYEAARMRYRGKYFDEFVVPQSMQHEVEKQIKYGNGALHVLYKRAEGDR